MEKHTEKLLRAADRLESKGWPFVAKIIRDGIANRTPASAVLRAVPILEKGKSFSEAKRLTDIILRK